MGVRASAVPEGKPHDLSFDHDDQHDADLQTNFYARRLLTPAVSSFSNQYRPNQTSLNLSQHGTQLGFPCPTAKGWPLSGEVFS